MLSPGDPDPAGQRLAVVRRTLADNPNIVALFWDYASLYQARTHASYATSQHWHLSCYSHPIACASPCHPTACWAPPSSCFALWPHTTGLTQRPLSQRPRIDDQNASFARALNVMADVYASAVGTTVLQLKEIPPRPVEFDGALCLFVLIKDVDEAAVRRAVQGIIRCDLAADPPRVYFASHDVAMQAKSCDAWAKLCDGCNTLYNERSYGSCSQDEGGDADNGRGWFVAFPCTPPPPLSAPSLPPVYAPCLSSLSPT